MNQLNDSNSTGSTVRYTAYPNLNSPPPFRRETHPIQRFREDRADVQALVEVALTGTKTKLSLRKLLKIQGSLAGLLEEHKVKSA
jgi:hypothetical protein